MSLFYSLAYRLGVTPWEKAATHPPAVSQVNALFDREERGRQPPFGRALDLGCGTGHWTVVLAQRGWEVTGVDLVPKAVSAASERVRRAGVDAQIVEADITTLGNSGIGSGFRLVWDFGTIHGLTPAQRLAAGREVTRLAAGDCTLLLLAWAPGRRGPLPRGANREDVEEAFSGWTITHDEPFDATGLPGPLRNVNPRVYRLARSR